MFGKGLIKGLGITLREFFTRKITVEYPYKMAPIPERFHGRFELDAEACIACSLCANACPNGVIEVAKTKVDKKNVLTGYRMDIGYCLFCGLCVEACPKGALKSTKDFEMSVYRREDVPLVLLAQREGVAAPVEKEVAAGD